MSLQILLIDRLQNLTIKIKYDDDDDGPKGIQTSSNKYKKETPPINPFTIPGIPSYKDN